MSFLDLTGRRTFTTSGTPTLVAGPGVGVDQVTHFDGALDWLQSVEALADFAFGTGDFCVEVAARITRHNVVLVDFYRTGYSGWQLWVTAAGLVQWWRGDLSYLNGTAVPLGEFVVLAADRRAGVLRLFVNGILVATMADTFGYSTTVDVFALGAQVAQRNSNYDLLGDIAWSRVTRASRYVGTYTPALPMAGTGDPLWGQTVMLFVSGNVAGGSGAAAVTVIEPVQRAVGLKQVSNGVFDLMFYDPEIGDQAVETLVYAVLFTDAEAPAGREPDRYLRRGWWLAAESGCGLWHVRRQPLGSAARLEAVELVRTVLEAHGLTDLSVTERSPAGVSGVVLDITGLYRDRSFLVSVPL